MKKLFLSLILLLVASIGWADPGRYTSPSFPGGTKALLDYISENTVYPEEARKQNLSGRVVLTFYIETDGSVSNVKVLKSVHGKILS